MMSDETRIDEVGFEAAVRELEQTVADLESGELGLDRALAKYQQGVQLLTRCYGLLDGAERIVALLKGVDAEGNPVTAPFDATATAGREAAAEPRRAVRANPSAPGNWSETADALDDPPF